MKDIEKKLKTTVKKNVRIVYNSLCVHMCVFVYMCVCAGYICGHISDIQYVCV